MPHNTTYAIGDKLRLALESGLVVHATVEVPNEAFLNQQFGREYMSLLEREGDEDYELDYIAVKITDVDHANVIEDWEGSPEVNEIFIDVKYPDYQHLLSVSDLGEIFIEMGDFCSKATVTIV